MPGRWGPGSSVNMSLGTLGCFEAEPLEANGGNGGCHLGNQRQREAALLRVSVTVVVRVASDEASAACPVVAQRSPARAASP